VEHGTDGMGPYCGGYGRDEMTGAIGAAHRSKLTHPTTCDDGFWEMGLPERHRHGLNRYKHVREWFAGFAADLRREGFVVAVYDVPATHVLTGESGKQVVFNPDHARLVRKQGIWRERVA
jgi:hypothetical protein